MVFQAEPIFRNLFAKTYKVFVKDYNNCVDIAQSEIFENCFTAFYIPTAFSPNQDGINDNWIISTLLKDTKLISLNVYNRWGEVIHQISDVELSSGYSLWNGSSKNQLTQSGLYTFTIKIQYNKVSTYSHTGQVMVVSP